ncbi:MAG: polyprenyl diphosphate synthase [Gammaproteobacteria bacterium]
MNQSDLPQHIAIVMDGNGRWAEQRNLPRIAGHRAGIASVREVVTLCNEYSIHALTLFAFSSENWQRPRPEVNYLMGLMFRSLKAELKKLHKNNVRFRVIGGRAQLSEKLQAIIADAEQLTMNNTGLNLTVAINYGGRWDILQAAKTLACDVLEQRLAPDTIDEHVFARYLSLPNLPEPDLFIRTSGEQRISNFFLWQLAYSELYFSPVYWPDFNRAEFVQALTHFSRRQRRFGGLNHKQKFILSQTESIESAEN